MNLDNLKEYLGRKTLNAPVSTHEEIIDIPVDDILDSFGSPFVYADIVRPDGGFGDLGFCYTRVVHPVLCEMFNSAVHDDPQVTERRINEILNLRHEDKLAVEALNSVISKIWLVKSTMHRQVTVNNKDVERLCVTILENIAGTVIQTAMDYSNRMGTGADGSIPYIQIDERCSVEMIPNKNPMILRVVVTYGWIYM